MYSISNASHECQVVDPRAYSSMRVWHCIRVLLYILCVCVCLYLCVYVCVCVCKRGGWVCACMRVCVRASMYAFVLTKCPNIPGTHIVIVIEITVLSLYNLYICTCYSLLHLCSNYTTEMLHYFILCSCYALCIKARQTKISWSQNYELLYIATYVHAEQLKYKFYAHVSVHVCACTFTAYI